MQYLNWPVMRAVAARRCRTFVGILLAVLLVCTADGIRPVSTYAAVSLKPGDFLLATGGAQGIFGVDSTTGTATSLTSNGRIRDPYYIAAGPDGEVYFMDFSYSVDFNTSRAVVARLDLTTGIPTVVTTLLVANGGLIGGGSGLAVDRTGALVVLDVNRIIRVDRATGQQTLISSGGLLSTVNRDGFNAEGIVIERDGSILTTTYVANDPRNHRQVVRIRPSTNAQEVAAVGGLIRYPFRMTVGPDGSIFVVDLNDEPNLDGPPVHYVLIQINPQTGAQRFVADLSDAGNIGGMITDSYGAIFASAIRISANPISSFEGIVRIDPVTGQIVVIANDARLVGIQPAGIAMVQVASPLPCPRAQRSPITVRTSALGNGRLFVSVNAAGNPNAIRAIRLGQLPGNAVLESQPAISGANATFVLRRTGPGAVTLPFTVADACGDWSTFVGGGPGAF